MKLFGKLSKQVAVGFNDSVKITDITSEKKFSESLMGYPAQLAQENVEHITKTLIRKKYKDYINQTVKKQ